MNDSKEIQNLSNDILNNDDNNERSQCFPQNYEANSSFGYFGVNGYSSHIQSSQLYFQKTDSGKDEIPEDTKERNLSISEL